MTFLGSLNISGQKFWMLYKTNWRSFNLPAKDKFFEVQKGKKFILAVILSSYDSKITEPTQDERHSDFWNI